MKILIVSPFFPYPLDSGGTIRIYNLIKHLSSWHDITLLSYINEDQQSLEDRLSSYCKVITLPMPDKKRSWPFHARYLFSRLPYSLVYVDNRFKEKLVQLGRRGFDVVQFEFLPFAHYVDCIKGPIKVLVEHYIATESRRRFIRLTNNHLLRLYYYFDLKKIAEFEKNVIGKFDHCIVTSEAHKQLLRQVAPEGDYTVVENGVDVDFFSHVSSEDFHPHQLSFMGSFGLDPANFDGIYLFVDKIFPIVRSWYPDTTLKIIGTGLTSEDIRKLERPGVEVCGRVEDIRPEILKSHVFVMPIRSGSGTKIRIPTVMAIGRPIVATRIACEGLSAKDGHDLLIADDIQSFASGIKRLFEDTELYDKLVKNAQELVRTRYDWSRMAEVADNLYEGLLEQRES